MVVNRQFIRNRTDLQLHMSSSQHEDRRGNPQAEDLIVMESTGIDIILGQNWSVRNKLEMQPTKRVVKVQTSSGEQIEHEVQHTSYSTHVGMRIQLSCA